MTKVRWQICWLLFFATTISYVDRAVLAVLKPMLEQKLHWTQIDYGWMVTFFQLTYAIGYAFAGGLIDKIGVRWGLLSSVVLWSLATIQHAVARSVTGFNVARSWLGLMEGGMFPAAIKTVAEWYPAEERALATGLFNAGSNVGAVVCPLVVPYIALKWGWQATFVVMGALGFVWAAAWLWLYHEPGEHPSMSPAELAFIRKDAPAPVAKIPWRVLLRYRQTWAFAVGMAVSAPIWWFYIFWAPDFLNKRYHLGLTETSLPLVAMFLAAGGGGIAGGWLSSWMLRRGLSVNVARKTAMLICALFVMPVIATPMVTNPWVAITLVGIAATAHSGFAANLFTFATDIVPKQAVSSVVGIGGMVGSIGGIVFAQAVSRILNFTNNNYTIPFAIASMTYLVGLGIIHMLLPHLEPMQFDSTLDITVTDASPRA